MKKRISAMLLALVMVLSLLPTTAFAADEGEPKNSKELKDNGDGTYTITLSVTGQGDTTTTTSGANVVVVLDVSGSMDESTGNEGISYVVWDGSGGQGTKFGRLESGEYVELTDFGWLDYVWYYLKDDEWVKYDGTVFVRRTTTSRLSEAKEALNTLATTLLNQNTDADPDMVEMALVVFADDAAVIKLGDKNKTTDLNEFKTAVDARYANGGTNWEDGLLKAKDLSFGDTDPTYIIFISDGNPTYRKTATADPAYTSGRKAARGRDQYYTATDDENYDTKKSNEGIYGNGWDSESLYDLSANNVQRCYNTAAPVAKQIVEGGKTLYTIGAYGNVDRMSSLTDYAYGDDGNGSEYYNSVSDTAALNSTLSEIANEITNSLALTKVSFSDGITGMTSVAVSGSADGFTYEKNGKPWTGEDVPKAKFEGGKVVWNLGDTKLSNGESASVSFVVYPSQEALDLIADLNNGVKTWDDLTEEQENQIKGGPDGPYSLKTNTEAKLTYSTVTTTTPAGGTPVDDISKPKTIDMTRTGADGISVESTQLKLKKVWNATLQPDQVDDVLYENGDPNKPTKPE